LEAFNIRHSGLDPESRIYVWIPAFAGMTTLIYTNTYATFRLIINSAINQTNRVIPGLNRNDKLTKA